MQCIAFKRNILYISYNVFLSEEQSVGQLEKVGKNDMILKGGPSLIIINVINLMHFTSFLSNLYKNNLLIKFCNKYFS